MFTLLIASLAFYGYWQPIYLALLIGSILTNYALSVWMLRWRAKQEWILGLGITLNLLSIGYFKYASFLYQNTLWYLGDDPFSSIILPLGISFFTFQQIAYLIDLKRNEKTTAPSIGHYSLFVSFFPQLIAGPIVLFRNIHSQLIQKRAPSFVDSIKFKSGFILFSIGLFKKVVIADSFAPFVQSVYSYAARDGTVIGVNDAVIGSLAYSLQLYFDFSAYSDMAVGLARMLGLRIPFNFNSPYKARNIIDFWRRWHITLTRFFREYVYIPLGGNRQGLKRQIINIGIVFILTGLWHGAGWVFVIWGGIHGLFLILNHLWRRCVQSPPIYIKKYVSLIKNITQNDKRIAYCLHIVSWGITMYIVIVLWALFRSENMAIATKMIKALTFQEGIASSCLFGLAYDTYCGAFSLVPFFAVCFIACAFLPNSRNLVAYLQRKGNIWLNAGLAGLALYLAISSIGLVESEFLYFQF